MHCPGSRLDVRKPMCVIPFFFPVELHLLPLHLPSIRKLLCRAVCLVSPFYIELRMRSFYIFRAKIKIPCTGRLRPVKILLFLPSQELGHPQLSSHRSRTVVTFHPPSCQPGQLITNLHSLNWHWEYFPTGANCTSFQLEGRNLCCRQGQNPRWEGG